MMRSTLSVVVGLVVASIASAQQEKTAEQIKACSRTMTSAMRNCNGQVPSVKANGEKSSEGAQGRGEELSCNGYALNDYLACIWGGWGVANKNGSDVRPPLTPAAPNRAAKKTELPAATK